MSPAALQIKENKAPCEEALTGHQIMSLSYKKVTRGARLISD